MSSAISTPRVVAVVVAWNRRELLIEVLDALAAQTVPPAAVVVIDNASSDGSGEAALLHPLACDVVTLDRNTGGAGGFATGLARAVAAHDSDWVWAMDDDTVPMPGALAALLDAVKGEPNVVVAGSRVVWTDGRDHPMNTPRQKPFARRVEREAAARRGSIAVRSSSFVSMLVSTGSIRERGLPISDYFIWNDDFEYSTRLLRGRRGLAVPASVVIHKTKALASTDGDPGPRFYNEVRNKIWMLRLSNGLNPAEKMLYGASSVRRWIRTVARSQDRSVLCSGFRSGWRDGWGTRPRPNAEALAGLGEVSAQVATIESGVLLR